MRGFALQEQHSGRLKGLDTSPRLPPSPLYSRIGSIHTKLRLSTQAWQGVEQMPPAHTTRLHSMLSTHAQGINTQSSPPACKPKAQWPQAWLQPGQPVIGSFKPGGTRTPSHGPHTHTAWPDLALALPAHPLRNRAACAPLLPLPSLRCSAAAAGAAPPLAAAAAVEPLTVSRSRPSCAASARGLGLTGVDMGLGCGVCVLVR